MVPGVAPARNPCLKSDSGFKPEIEIMLNRSFRHESVFIRNFGPAVEVGLPFRLAAEVDVLYKRVGERAEGCEFTYCSFSSSRAHAIEIPLLAKFRILRGSVAPYAAGGYALRYITKSSGTFLQWRS